MMRENRELRREVVGNHNLINGLTNNLGWEIEDSKSRLAYCLCIQD